MNKDPFKNIDQEKIDKIFEDYKNDQFQELYNEFIKSFIKSVQRKHICIINY